MDLGGSGDKTLSVDYSDQIEKVCQKMSAESKCNGRPSREGSFTEIPLKDSCKSTVKLPRRILHFSDGILEEYSTDDEVDNEESKPLIDPKMLTWIPYLWHLTTWFGTRTLSVCDYVGEYLAYMFGITSPKFQYEIDEYKRMIEEEEENKKKEAEETAGWGDHGSSTDSLKTVEVEPPSLNTASDSSKSFINKESNHNEIEMSPYNWERF